MIGPQLQSAVVAALKGVPLFGGAKVYDRPPAAAPYPYVTVGDEQAIDDGDQCGTLFEVAIDVHIWSRNAGRAEAKAIGEQIRQVLELEPALVVVGYAVIFQDFESARVFFDPDGITAHGVVTFRLELQQLEPA